MKLCGRSAQRFLRTIEGKTLRYAFEYWLDAETNVVLAGSEASFANDEKKLLGSWTCKTIQYQ